MITALYLSHWDREAVFTLSNKLRDEYEIDVYTNYDKLNSDDPDYRTDRRMRAIRGSDYFIFFGAPVGTPQLIRSIELGFAIGAEVPVAFIGRPRNSFHRWGDVFDDTDDFVDAWLESEAKDTA